MKKAYCLRLASKIYNSYKQTDKIYNKYKQTDLF